jgi:type I restriction enzyme S subunit
MTTSQDFVTWSCSDALNPDYLMRALLAEGDEIRRFGEGSTHTTIYFPAVKAFTLDLPPRGEQRRIVAKLDALTVRLARARAELDRVAVLAPRQRLALLRSAMSGSMTAGWRGEPQLEPMSAMLDRIPVPKQGRGGREATAKVVPGAAGLSINDPATDLPEGWAWVPLLRVAKQETGHTPSRSQPSYWDGGVPWVGIRDAGAHHGRTIETTMQTISDEGLANSSARLLPAGTVCLSRTASVGYVTIMGRSMATSQDFATWTCTDALDPEYLMYALMAEGEDIRKFGMGSTHTTIYFPEIRALHIALPPIEEQREIVARLKSALARADCLEAEATRARALIDRLEAAILGRAFRGELVPQDPAEEPASVLLDRIRAERAAMPKVRRSQRKKQAVSLER